MFSPSLSKDGRVTLFFSRKPMFLLNDERCLMPCARPVTGPSLPALEHKTLPFGVPLRNHFYFAGITILLVFPLDSIAFIRLDLDGGSIAEGQQSRLGLSF